MTRITPISILIGTGLWTLLLFAPAITIIPRVLLLAVLVIVPLALWRVDAPAPLLNAQPIGALLMVIAFLLPAGLLSGGLALSWLAFTGLVALLGLVRLRAHRFSDAAELCLTVGMLYLPVGGVWLVASRLGVPVLGFGEPLVSLTAVHFHYAGFAALVIAGLTGRRLAGALRRLFRWVASGLMAGMALVAAGITFSPLLEVAAAGVFAASITGLALLQLIGIVPRLSQRWPQVSLTVSSLMGIWAMGAAVVYAVSEYTHSAFLLIPQMLRIHGEVNALGFVLLNLLGWALIRKR